MNFESQSAFIIYGQLNLRQFPEYYCFQIFDDRGQLDQETLEQIYREFSQEELHPYYVGPFADKEQLDRFAFKICLERGKDSIRLISYDEYNQVLEVTNDRQSLVQGLENVGQSLENLEAPKKGLLGKIFR